jgi:hypothetical protein
MEEIMYLAIVDHWGGSRLSFIFLSTPENRSKKVRNSMGANSKVIQIMECNSAIFRDEPLEAEYPPKE